VITFETDVQIERPLEEVFAYLSEPLNFPRWNSAVEAVRKTSAGEDGVASSYLMERELPTGHAVNRLEVVASEPPREFAIRTSAGRRPSSTAIGSRPRTARRSSSSPQSSTWAAPPSWAYSCGAVSEAASTPT
jgi:uncharacterized protein YndB with AHSA1/START domain